jgi:hypothetical protein
MLQGQKLTRHTSHFEKMGLGRDLLRCFNCIIFVIAALCSRRVPVFPRLLFVLVCNNSGLVEFQLA